MDQEKLLKSKQKAENLQTFIDHSNNLFEQCSESLVQFLLQNACSLRFLRSNRHIRTIGIQIGNNYWDLEIYRKF